MGLFSSNSSNHFGNSNMDRRPSFPSHDHGNTYGSNSANANATAGQGIFGRDHSAGLANQPNNINTTRNSGVMSHDLNTDLTNHNTHITGDQGYFHQNDGGALGQPNTNTNMTGNQGISHHDRNAAVVDPTTTSYNTEQHGTSGYNGISAYSKTGTDFAGHGGWFSRRRNRDNGIKTCSKTSTGGTKGGGFFGRRGNRDTNIANFGLRPSSHRNRHQRERLDINSGRYNKRPSFGQWLKFTWLDILTMIVLGAVGLGVYQAHPAPSRSFPVYFQDGEIVYPQFAYPLRHEIVPIWLAAFLASTIPIFIILCMQFRIRSFWDVNNAIIGLLYSLITAAVFQVFLKWLIGGLRPHFLIVCKPVIPNKGIEIGNGFKQIMYDRSICSGDRNSIDDSLESFPSGHSTAAFAGFIFLCLYLNAKLKVFSNHHPAMWKLVATYAPVLGATLIAGTLTIDEYHNWYDCVAGAIIGTIMAFSAYRMVYASVWDFRFNHIPLTRHTPFSYGAGEAGAGGFETAVFSHAAGWGYHEAYGGAPFDAAHNLRGAMTGFNHGVHDPSYGYKSNQVNGNNTNNTTRRDGTTCDVITADEHPDPNEKTGTLGRDTNTFHSRPNNVNSGSAGVVNNGNHNSVLEPAAEPATSTRGGGFHQSNKGLERRPVGGRLGGQGADHMV